MKRILRQGYQDCFGSLIKKNAADCGCLRPQHPRTTIKKEPANSELLFLPLCIFHYFFLFPFHPVLEVCLIAQGNVGKLYRKGHQAAGNPGTDIKLAPVMRNAGHFVIFYRHVESTERNVVIGVYERPWHSYQQFFLTDEGHRIVNAIDTPKGERNHQGSNKVEYQSMIGVVRYGKNHSGCTDKHINERQKNDIQL